MAVISAPVSVALVGAGVRLATNAFVGTAVSVGVGVTVGVSLGMAVSVAVTTCVITIGLPLFEDIHGPTV